MEFNNTVKEVCDNLDSLVLAVVSAMEGVFGIPFTGQVTEINKEKVESACNVTLSSMRRRQLRAVTTSRTSATVATVSKTFTTPSNIGTKINGNSVTKAVLTSLENTSPLTTAAALSTSKIQQPIPPTDQQPSTTAPPQDSTATEKQENSNTGVIVAVSVAAVVVFGIMAMARCSKSSYTIVKQKN
jgi:hypothetical protein